MERKENNWVRRFRQDHRKGFTEKERIEENTKPCAKRDCTEFGDNVNLPRSLISKINEIMLKIKIPRRGIARTFEMVRIFTVITL